MTAEQTRLDQAIELVLRDVSTVLGPDVLTASTSDEYYSGVGVRGLPGVGSGPQDRWIHVPGEVDAVCLVDDGRPFVDLVVWVAGWVQEFVHDHLAVAGASTFPPCPLHQSHPRWPEVLGGRSMWVCAQTVDPGAPIGAVE